jgi:hypothetical protein
MNAQDAASSLRDHLQIATFLRGIDEAKWRPIPRSAPATNRVARACTMVHPEKMRVENDLPVADRPVSRDGRPLTSDDGDERDRQRPNLT